MTPTITKEQFLTYAKKGWENLDFITNKMFSDENGNRLATAKDATSACILGAAVFGMSQDYNATYFNTLYPKLNSFGTSIAVCNNKAKSKKEAIANVSDMIWETEQEYIYE